MMVSCKVGRAVAIGARRRFGASGIGFAISMTVVRRR